MRRAVFGGTFDPVHLGHLIVAEQAYNSFDLDQVIFMPAGIPPHKIGQAVSPEEKRLEMVRLALADNPHFLVSDWELEQEDYSYTVDTLKHLREEYPDDQLFFIIGADSLQEIFSWKDPDFLLDRAQFIVARRPDYTLENIYSDERLRPYRDNILLMENFLVDISSTLIRELVNRQKSIKYLTLPVVIDYINRNNLYRGD